MSIVVSSGGLLEVCRIEVLAQGVAWTDVPDYSLIAPWGVRSDLESIRHIGPGKIESVPDVPDLVYDGLRACARTRLRADKERSGTSGTPALRTPLWTTPASLWTT